MPTQVKYSYNGEITETTVFVLEAHAETVVEIMPSTGSSITASKSSAYVSAILAESANCHWFPFPSMPTAAAYEEIVYGAQALRLEVGTGDSALVNIRRIREVS